MYCLLTLNQHHLLVVLNPTASLPMYGWGFILDPYPQVFCAMCHHPLPHLNTFWSVLPACSCLPKPAPPPSPCAVNSHEHPSLQLCLVNVFFHCVLHWAAGLAVSPPPGRAPPTPGSHPIPFTQAVLWLHRANNPKGRFLFPRTDLAWDRAMPLTKGLIWCAGERPERS